MARRPHRFSPPLPSSPWAGLGCMMLAIALTITPWFWGIGLIWSAAVLAPAFAVQAFQLLCVGIVPILWAGAALVLGDDH